MTFSTKIEVFYGFYICSQWAFIHALLSRVPFALAGRSCCLRETSALSDFCFRAPYKYTATTTTTTAAAAAAAA